MPPPPRLIRPILPIPYYFHITARPVRSSLKPQQPFFSKGEMARLQETAGVRGFLDDFVTCPDTIRQVGVIDLIDVDTSDIDSAICNMKYNMQY